LLQHPLSPLQGHFSRIAAAALAIPSAFQAAGKRKRMGGWGGVDNAQLSQETRVPFQKFQITLLYVTHWPELCHAAYLSANVSKGKQMNTNICKTIWRYLVKWNITCFMTRHHSSDLGVYPREILVHAS
jgi:hypothetical protein